MKIVTTTYVNWDGGPLPDGTELDVPDEVAKRWIARGAAKPAAAPLVQRSKPCVAKPEE